MWYKLPFCNPEYKDISSKAENRLDSPAESGCRKWLKAESGKFSMG